MANLLYPASTGHTVDDKFSPLVEPNLWANKPFQPGLTFTDKYQMGPAGQIMVHKPGKDSITATHPGADFNHAVVQDSLVTIILNKQFNRSRKIFGATLATVSYDMAAAELETALEEIAEAWQKEALNAVVLQTGVNAGVAATAISDIYADIVANRKKLVEKGAKPDTLIVSPDVYAKLLKSPEFQRVGDIGDKAVAEGMVGRIAGMNVFEYQAFGDYTTSDVVAGHTLAAGDTVDYIMYDHDALAIVTALDAIRVIDEPSNFVGILAQAQVVSGYKLTNVDRALVRYTDVI